VTLSDVRRIRASSWSTWAGKVQIFEAWRRSDWTSKREDSSGIGKCSLRPQGSKLMA
jgi:hypothetical protein